MGPEEASVSSPPPEASGSSPPPEASGSSPPADAEEWTDEQWIAWLEATDDPDDETRQAARSQERPRQRGGMLGAAMLGLRDAIYGRPDDEVVAIVDGSGDPPDDDHPNVHLDPEHPERSEVFVHPRRRTDRSEDGRDP